MGNDLLNDLLQDGPLNGEHADLWRRVAAHDLDADAPAGWFVARLARDNGWSLHYANRVIEEYRRYAFLTCVAGHVVVPSEQVDQAWHQHLLDSQPYWEAFCRQVLRKPLHHRPSKGGVDDRQRHVAWYEQSLDSYARYFGHPPPTDIWPEPRRRFGRDLRQRRIALSEHWVLSKRRIARAAGVVLLVGVTTAGVAAAPRYTATLNPFDLTGPAFLGLFAGVFVGAFVITLLLRRRMLAGPAWPTADQRAADDLKLDPYEAATLHTNAHLAINAAIAALERDGALHIATTQTGRLFKTTHYKLVKNGPLRPDALPLERAVFKTVADERDGLPLNTLHEHLKSAAAAMKASLERRGLLVGSDFGLQRFLIALPLLAVVGFGAIKVFVGIARDRPVVFLFVGCMIALVVALAMAAGAKRTRLGEEALRKLKAQRPTKPTHAGPAEVPDGRELAWLVAIFGVGVLSGGVTAPLHAALTAHAHAGGGGTDTSGCGGGCGGGGCGGGCGGCGD